MKVHGQLKNIGTGEYDLPTDEIISDDVYAVGWDGVTTIAPSKNAVYDKIETLMAKFQGIISGNWTIRTSAADNKWCSVCWSPELNLFVAVAYTGVGNRVMTSLFYT